MSKGKVRLIAGQWRGRNLTVIDDKPGLRPTPNRVRETVFNWLMPVLPGAKVLDLFAGTGALGFEAMSRGAEQLTCVETDAELIDLLRHNQQALAAENVEIVHADAVAYLANSRQDYDVIFLDPPFAQDLVLPVCESILERKRLRANGYLYVESETALSLPNFLVPHKQKSAGQVQYGLYTLSLEE